MTAPFARLLAGAATALLVSGCSWRPSMPDMGKLSPFAPYAVTTTSHVAPAFAGYRTYAWVLDPATDPAANTLNNDSQFTPIIQDEVEAELAAKGYFKAAPGQRPDFRLAGMSVIRDYSGEIVGDRYFGGKSLDDIPASVAAPKIPAGEDDENATLIIDARDGRTGAVSWRGSARTPVDRSREPDDRIKAIEEVVRKLMAPLPTVGEPTGEGA